MEKIHGNMHVFMLSCEFLTRKHKNMRISMYFLYLVLTFTPHYIITENTIASPGFPIETVATIDMSTYNGASG